MPKVLLVALPLLLAAAVLALQLLRRRAPSRTAINIVSSVLLLVYVATTAGLGIFWVANQQLPVFDWHYLFGYGTVLLVSLHLAFNLPLVWRFFARRADRGRDLSPTAAVATRRGLLGALGVLAATGAGFVLGLRHGRSELTIGPGPAGPSTATAGAAALPAADGAAATALALVERFHAFSAHSRTGVLRRAPSVGWGEPPPPFKRHAGAPRTRLPAPGAGTAPTVDLAALAAILWHTTGVTEHRGGLALRASPSSGALFATELYLLVRAWPGVEPGVLHYEPEAHALERLGPASIDALPPGAIDAAARRDAAVLVVATAVFERSGHKYRDRTYRYVLADLGHALENLRVAAAALGVPATFVAGFDEARLAGVLGVDETVEGVLAVVALGGPGHAGAASAAPPAAAAPARWRIPPPPSASVSAPAPSRQARDVTVAVHAATSLQATAPPGATAAASAGPAPGTAALPAGVVVALPVAEPLAADGLRLIAARRSVRRYSSAALPLPALAAVLSRLVAAAGPALSPAVRIDLVVHAVEGLAPGAYRCQPERHALLHRRPLAPSGRAATRAAALDQDVIGDAAAVLVLSIDRALVAADPLGPGRGYRHAFLEAGRIGERVYLEAQAQGLGACAVGAFYDDEAAALVGVDPAREWVVHFAALGVKE